MSIALLVLATCVAVAAEVLLTRANPGVRLPLWLGQQPPRYPVRALVMRSLAIGLAVLGAITLDGHIGSASWLDVLLIVAAFLPALLVRLVQNGRVPAHPAQ